MSNRVLFIIVFVFGLLITIPLTRFMTESLFAPPVIDEWVLPNGYTLSIFAERSPDGGLAGMHYTLDEPDKPIRSSRRHDRYYFASVIPYGDTPVFKLFLDTETQMAIVVQDVKPNEPLIMVDIATHKHWPGFGFDAQGAIRDTQEIADAGEHLLAKARNTMPTLSQTLIAPQERMLLQTHEGKIIQTDAQGILIEHESLEQKPTSGDQ